MWRKAFSASFLYWVNFSYPYPRSFSSEKFWGFISIEFGQKPDRMGSYQPFKTGHAIIGGGAATRCWQFSARRPLLTSCSSFKMRSRSHTMSNFVTIGLSGITRTCCWGVNRISLKKQNRNSTFNYKMPSFDATKGKRSNIMNTNENSIFYLAK